MGSNSLVKWTFIWIMSLSRWSKQQTRVCGWSWFDLVKLGGNCVTGTLSWHLKAFHSLVHTFHAFICTNPTSSFSFLCFHIAQNTTGECLSETPWEEGELNTSDIGCHLNSILPVTFNVQAVIQSSKWSVWALDSVLTPLHAPLQSFMHPWKSLGSFTWSDSSSHYPNLVPLVNC